MFEKAKEKYHYYSSPIPPDTKMETLQKRWRSSRSIEAIQSVNSQENSEGNGADKLTSSTTN